MQWGDGTSECLHTEGVKAGYARSRCAWSALVVKKQIFSPYIKILILPRHKKLAIWGVIPSNLDKVKNRHYWGCCKGYLPNGNHVPPANLPHKASMKQNTFLYLRVLEIVTPQGPDFVLASHVPYSETNILILHCLDVETCEENG